MARNDRVYFLYAPSVNAVKIGMSGNPEERLRVISPGSPVDIYLLGSFPSTEAMHEKVLHEEYEEYGIRWGWFTCDSPLHDLLTELFGDTYLSLREDESPQMESVELNGGINTRRRWWEIWKWLGRQND